MFARSQLCQPDVRRRLFQYPQLKKRNYSQRLSSFEGAEAFAAQIIANTSRNVAKNGQWSCRCQVDPGKQEARLTSWSPTQLGRPRVEPVVLKSRSRRGRIASINIVNRSRSNGAFERRREGEGEEGEGYKYVRDTRRGTETSGETQSLNFSVDRATLSCKFAYLKGRKLLGNRDIFRDKPR